MLKRVVKEAPRTAMSSGGESSDRRKRRTGTPRRRHAATSSSDEGARQRKRRDANSDDDSDGGGKHIKKKGSSVAGKSARNNNIDNSSGDESDGDQKGETTDTPRENTASTNLFKKKLQSKLKRMWNAGKMKRTPLLELATIEAVYSAMHGKDKKRARTKLLEMFAHYDIEETGGIDGARFTKCITKAGVHLRKPDDYNALVHCFTKSSSVSSGEVDDESAGEKKRKKTTTMSNMVDYISFVDFACNVRDSEKLSQIADKLNKIIDKYDDKHNQSTTDPFSIFVDLKKLDKKKRKWIPSEQFAAFLQEHERPVFKLSSKEVQALTERFEYEYEKDELGVDYEQFARWLQPMLHLDIKELHKRVQDLVKKANERGGWDLVEVFRAMDNDGDGEVSGAELKEALLEMGLPLTDTQIRCLVDEYDTNGDGRIQYGEFIALFPFLKEKNKKDVKGSESAKKKKNVSKEADESEDSRSDLKPNGKKKNTRKNTFSWDIGKAFARKHTAHGNSSMPAALKKKNTTKTRKEASSSEDSSDDSRDKAKGKSAKTGKKVAVSSSDEESDSDQRRKTTRRATSRAKKKSRDSPSDASDSYSKKSSSENQAARRGRDHKARRGGTRRDPSSTETDEDTRVKTKPKSKKSSKPAAVTTDDSDAKNSSSPATESSAKPRSPRRKKNVESSPTKRRSDRQLSTVSHRSHRSVRRSQSRNRSRQRFASAASGKAKPPTRSHSRVDRYARFSSRKKSSRRVPRDFDHDDGATSSAESESESESSGLDMSQLRQLKKETSRHEGSDSDNYYLHSDEDDEEAEHIRTRSDGEYEKHLKRSLRRAFDFFDLDQSDTIEKKELSHVLRALGHEFTTEELDDEMARADLDQNGQLDYHEFVAFVKRQLVQKQFFLSKHREMEIRQAFQSLDNDKNGVLDEKEFEYLIYKVLGVELSVEEQDALLDFVDENSDGIINEDEFIAFMRIMEDFHKAQGGRGDRQRQFLKALDGTSKLALTAMKKLVRGAPIDLDRNLLMFFGVPTNFRPAISSFATCRTLQANTLEHVLSFPSPQIIVALAQDPSQSSSEKKNGLMFGPTAASAMKSPEDGIDENALLQQAESWQSQAIASLKRATGVPKPFDTREEDVVKRCVHVCLFQEQEEIHGKSLTSRASAAKKKKRAQQQPKIGGGVVVGNVHEIPVYWHPGQEDVWEFSKKATKEDKYKFLMRTNTVNDHLYLLVEFIVHLRMAKREKTRKGRRRHRKHKSSKRDDPVSDNEDTTDGLGETREMVCCWCKVPIRTLLAKRAGVFRSQLKLWGGTAHAPVDIEQDEILRRRTGWRALANVFTKPTPPAMGIKSVPIEMLPEELQLSVRKMPSTIIAPFLSLPIIAEYMTLMKTMLSSGNGSSAGVACEPVLKLLPHVIDDHEALSIFRRVFDAEMALLKTTEDRQRKFQELVLRMWPSQVQWRDELPSTLQVQIAASSVGSSRRLSVPGMTTKSAQAQLTTTAARASTQGFAQTTRVNGGRSGSVLSPTAAPLSRTNWLQSSAQGKVRFQDLRIASAPFHVREVAFERMV